MKVRILLSCMVLLLLILSACGGGPPEGEGVDPEVKKAYQNKVKEVVDLSNELLATYNKGLDELYTNSTSSKEFAGLMAKNIEQSNEMVRGIDEYVAEPMYFEVHQTVITHLNNQHQMFLDAVEMANEDDINKEALRTRYLEIKAEQQQVINSIRAL